MKHLLNLILLLACMHCKAQYCAANFSNGSSLNYHIESVEMNGFSNLNTGFVTNLSYQDYTNLGPIQVNSGSTYTLTITTGNGAYNKVAIWIDFNDDQVFVNNELIDVGTNISGTATFNIPIATYFGYGPKRLRIRTMPSTVTTPVPCYNVQDPDYPGETEDYTLNINYVPNTYCTPMHTVGTLYNDIINNVYMNTMSNMAQTGVDSFPYFEDYTNLGTPTTLYPGVGYTLRVSGGPNPGLSYAVWLDFNRDSIFDLSEKMGEMIHQGNYAQMYFGVGFPLTAAQGPTRLRIRCEAQVVGLDPCASYVYGETEDYLVNIQMTSPNYCTANLHNVPCTPQDVINTVAIQGTTLINANTACDFTTTGYVNWNVTSYTTANLDVMNFYNFEVTSSTNSQIKCWIDFNHDNIFQTNEYYSITDASQANTPSVLIIWIPSDAMPGPTRMRIRSCSANGEPMFSGDACMPFSSGQTEDYTLNIINNTVGINHLELVSGLSIFIHDDMVATVYCQSKNNQLVSLNVFDVLGRQVVAQQNMLVAGENKLDLPIQNMRPGVYMLNLQVGDLSKVTKFVVK